MSDRKKKSIEQMSLGQILDIACILCHKKARSRSHLILGLKQGSPLHSPYGCKLGLHPWREPGRLKLQILAPPEFNTNKRCIQIRNEEPKTQHMYRACQAYRKRQKYWATGAFTCRQGKLC